MPVSCPCQTKNFVDKEAEFIYVPAKKVQEQAKALLQVPAPPDIT